LDGRASLERLLLLRLLELLGLLTWISRKLRLLLLLRLLRLSKVLRLPRIACELRLHWASTKSSRLRCQSALEASLLLERLLAILRLAAGSGAVAAAEVGVGAREHDFDSRSAVGRDSHRAQ
jgi:hypothetical protein